jgi:putative DNA primase/helicase
VSTLAAGTVAEVARLALAAGYQPVLVHERSKRPVGRDWQSTRYTIAEDIEAIFTPPYNIGLNLGVSNLVDADLDSVWARQLAPAFLPPSAMIWGRASERAGHWCYRPVGLVTYKKYLGVGRSVLLERRAGDGLQSVVPPSVHQDTGEAIEWERPGPAGEVDAADLIRAFDRLAAASLIASVYPGEGSRHDFCLAMAGYLAKNGGDAVLASELLEPVVRLRDERTEINDRLDAIRSTFDLAENPDAQVVGYRKLEDILGAETAKAVAAKLREWLGLAPRGPVGDEQFTDSANAERLAVKLQGQAVYAFEMKNNWFIFDGTRLVLRPRQVLYPYIKGIADDLRAHGGRVGDKAMLAGAHRLGNQGGVDGCIEQAKGIPSLWVKMADFDAHPTWLNTPAGTLDLETGESWAPRFEDLLTKLAGAPYDPAATCLRFKQFLAEIIPNPEVRAFLQRSVGYSLTDETRERCFWILHGIGRNGKTTLINAIRAVLGDYAMATRATTLMVKKFGDDKRNDVAILRGARFVSATESEEGEHLAAALVKELTGQDPVTARLLYCENFSFVPTFKIWLATNHKPTIRSGDPAIWDRVFLVPFEVRISEEQVDHTLADQLAREASGILNWAIAGFEEWKAGGLRPPEEVREATATYREEMDTLRQFFEECTVIDPQARCKAQDLYEAYQSWAGPAGLRFPMSKNTFGALLKERGFTPHKDGDGTRWWVGLQTAVKIGGKTVACPPEWRRSTV